MKILDRYVLREFTSYLVLSLIGFIVIFVVVDVFQKIDVFLDHKAPASLVTAFYLYRAPEVVVLVLPVALLLATFLALGQLNKFNELTAMRASGRSLVAILTPVFQMAVVMTVFSLLLSELIVPRANRERDRIYDERIQGMRHETVAERADLTYLGQGNRIFIMRLYLVREKRMHEVSLQEFSGGALVRRVDAAEATWDGHDWVFTSGMMRTFEGGVEHARPFERMTVKGIVERPEDFAKEARSPEEMNYFELRDFVERTRSSGARVSNYLVDLHLKLAFPLVNLIVVMIGAPIATRLRMQSAALGFGLSVAIAFIYYAFMRTGQALGHNGALPPYIAAWMGDLFFGIFGLTMMVQAQRR